MNPVFLTVSLLLVLALLALSLWLRHRLDARRPSEDDGERSRTPLRFDTTMGDLRDLREALRPTAGSGQEAIHPTRPRRVVTRKARLP